MSASAIEPSRGVTFRSSRLALLIGFGSLLAITGLAGWDALRILGPLRRQEEQIRSQFLFRNRLLNNIRAELYLSGTYVRDYLLDPDPARAAGFGSSLSQVRRQMDADLASYSSQLQPEELEHYTALRADLADYWQLIDPVLRWTVRERQAHGYRFLRDELFPRRTAILDIAGRIGQIDEQQAQAGNERAAAVLRQFQTRLAETLVAALGLGLVMAAFSVRKILQLEEHAHARYREVEEARKQLTGLSARLVEAQESERRALSRELHDEIGQSLSAVLLELRNLSRGLAASREDQTRTHVDTIKSLVEGTVRVVRNMALLLRPSMLDDLGLVPALRWQADEVSKRTGMNVTIETRLTSEDLPDQYKTCIYRVVQEALHNCSRHADATNVTVRVNQSPGILALTVEDDGRGFEAAKSKGLGLLGIEERAAQLGGTSKVHSEIGVGTTLSMELPFHDSATTLIKDHSETNPHPVS